MDRLSRVIAGCFLTVALGTVFHRFRLPQHAKRRAQRQALCDQGHPNRPGLQLGSSSEYDNRRLGCIRTMVRRAWTEIPRAARTCLNTERQAPTRAPTVCRQAASSVLRARTPGQTPDRSSNRRHLSRLSLRERTFFREDEGRLALNEPLSILFEDEHCLALDKPAGQFAQGTWAPARSRDSGNGRPPVSRSRRSRVRSTWESSTGSTGPLRA